MKNRRTSAFATLAILAASVAAPSARGDLIDGTITGDVTSAGGAVPGIAVGDLLSGSYTYDSSTTVNDILGPVNPFTAFSLTIGTNPHVFSLADLQPGGVVTPGVVPGNSTPTANALFFFFDPSVLASYIGASVASQSISNFPPQSYIVTSDDPTHSFAFDFTSPPTVVPEPSSLTLIGLGFVALARFGRRRVALVA